MWFQGLPIFLNREPSTLSFLSKSRRPHRAGEWSSALAVTFIVTLAATRSVTLAARAAGMSRKSAYALKDRDPAFASAWSAALAAAEQRRQGDKADKVDTPPPPRRQGNRRTRNAYRGPTLLELLMAHRDSGSACPPGNRPIGPLE